MINLQAQSDGTHSLLETSQIRWTQSICLCNNWNQVHSGAQSLHDLNVEWLQGVSGWSNEVQAGVDTEVDFVDTLWLLLLQHVGLMLIIQELNNWHPRVAVVDIVSKTWGIDNGKTD